MSDENEKKVAGINLASLMYSAFKKVSVVGLIYLTGYMQWSVAWLLGPIVLLVLRDKFREENERKRSIAKAIAIANEKDVVLARIDDLPAWVGMIAMELPDILRTAVSALFGASSAEDYGPN